MMKLYDFECKDCGHVFERLIKKPEELENTAVECLECGSTNTMRVVSTPNFKLNGSRWEKDGYGK